MESLDAYYTIQDASGAIIAGAGIAGDVIKCLAVDQEYRSEGLLVPLISRILALRGGDPAKVFTKPEYQAVFESMGFHLLASSPLAILLENGRGLQLYCDYLRAQALPGRCGVVVMNANPFTLGHQYLLEQASAQVDHLYVIPVMEDVSEFTYAERMAMICLGAPDNVHVLQGSDYVISSATFPTYFLKDLSKAAETHMALDLDLYNRWIAPALGASVRFVGSEPFDALTNHYNTLIPNAVIIPRFQNISASRVRKALEDGHFSEAAALCPDSTWPYLMAALAQRALQRELDTPGKPGLVGPDGPGAHKDMDYGIMMRGIRALRPYWSRMATALSADDLRSIGIEAEKAMLVATGGVNTHRGAIFALGLALNAQGDSGQMADLAAQICGNNHSMGARSMALSGYRQLFEDWLPYYAENGELKTLLHIMSTLDDTCVIKRVGQERAQKVKREAAEIAGQPGNDDPVMPDLIGHLCERYAAEGISPGGAADMLALTIFIDSIIS